ncbi:MAG: helix-turn-helix domain-containing protein [Dehalococcoidales bacterium]|nr:helix-turn-helix domain-containing protein [Dehalococcoidales bacterium]
MSLRLEFVCLATAEGANVRDLCRRFDVSPRTAYKWLRRAGVVSRQVVEKPPLLLSRIRHLGAYQFPGRFC